MYIPTHFRETRIEVLHELIRSHPLGALVTATSAGLDASHAPFMIDAEGAASGVLKCHVARANPIWRRLSEDCEALVIFQGADSYVSPSWYEAKKQHGKVVPTWDYVVVHAYGRPRVIHDPDWLRALVTELTARHESGRDEPWKVTDAPAGYVDKLLQAIVGIEISISRISGSWKLSQNRSAADRQGVIAGLSESTAEADAAVAQMIAGMLEREQKGD